MRHRKSMDSRVTVITSDESTGSFKPSSGSGGGGGNMPRKKSILIRDAEAGRQSRSRRWSHLDEPPKPRFSNLTIRMYPTIIGDNPGSSEGPPLSIDWKHEEEYNLGCDEYEEARPTRRAGKELMIPGSLRRDMLRHAGFSRQEIIEGTKPVNFVRAQRRKTRGLLELEPLFALQEKLARKTHNLLTLGEKKRKERRFLEPYILDHHDSRGSTCAGSCSGSRKNRSTNKPVKCDSTGSLDASVDCGMDAPQALEGARVFTKSDEIDVVLGRVPLKDPGLETLEI